MIARKSALIMFSQIANAIIGYIGLKFIALFMDPWEYGVVGFAFGFVALFSIFGNLGFDQAHIKRVSEGKDLGRCISTFVIIKIILAGVLASLTFITVAIWKFVLNRGFESSVHEQAVYIMIAYFVLFTITQTTISTFNARKETAKSQLPHLLYNIIRIIATIIVALNGYGPIALAFTYLLGEIFHLIFSLILFKNYSIKNPSIEYVKDYSKFAFPMVIASASAIIMTNIDKVLIQLFWSSRQVGEYFASYNISRYLVFFSNALGLLLFPTISEYHAKKDLKKISLLIRNSERYLSMIVFPIIIIMVVLAESIIHVMLSDKYLPAVRVLQILPFFALIEVFSRPYLAQLKGMNMPHIIRNRVLIMVIVNVFLNLLLIPKDIRNIGINLFGLGATGAAIATVISYIIGLIYSRYIAWKLTGFIGNIRIIIHAFSATIIGIILFNLNNMFYIDRWYHLLGFVMLGFCLYLCILFLLKEFTKDDLKFFLDIVNIKKMFRYIKEELRGN